MQRQTHRSFQGPCTGAHSCLAAQESRYIPGLLVVVEAAAAATTAATAAAAAAAAEAAAAAAAAAATRGAHQRLELANVSEHDDENTVCSSTLLCYGDSKRDLRCPASVKFQGTYQDFSKRDLKPDIKIKIVGFFWY